MEEPGNSKNIVTQYDDALLLEQIGYKQELKRSFSLLTMAGWCFGVTSFWTAIGGSLVDTMNAGGPIALVWGWVIVCAFSLMVALSLAELTSAYPVAGGQYSWVLILSRGTKWGRGLSYATAFVQLAGLFSLGSTALYQFGSFTCGMAVLNSDGETWRPTNWQVVLVCWAICFVCLLINIFMNKMLHHIGNFGLWWTIGGFVVCTVTILAVSKHKQDASFVFTAYTNNSGWNDNGMAALFLLNAAFAMCCYDAACHMGEEMDNASRDTARAVVLSVVIGFFTGFAFILALLFCLQDFDAVANTVTGVPLLEIFYQATNNSKAGATCLTVIVVVCQVLASNGMITEGSRSLYAFARDDAFPYQISKYIGTVNSKYDVPIYALIICALFQCAFIAIYFGSSTAFFTVMSIGTVGLYVSYLVPILVVMFRRKHKAVGYYNLGKWGHWVNAPAALYLIYCSVCFFFPTTLPITGDNMNYTPVAFAICAILGLLSWFLGGRHTYATQTESVIIEGVGNEPVVEIVEQKN
ncbi:Hnm1p [Sugiyamaella lignohabitans]|uniref:Hnm1p n=1 Tax=Sugiyamaella lignohabitans TaxID=796027 RepID=A0A161HJZ8_9ASCO|nr:Hnm1p [Sugiyamaella lignohabitans]ANB11858.1 Hnm1p [Sugiyamaella lignohabitans]